MQFLVIFFFFAVIQLGWTSDCNSDTGPPGKEECVQLSNYNSWQKAVCKRNDNPQRKKGHTCKDLSAIQYCWYPCMLEYHNKTSGDIAEDCSCTPPTTLPVYTQPPTTSSNGSSSSLGCFNCGLYGVVASVTLIWMDAI